MLNLLLVWVYGLILESNGIGGLLLDMDVSKTRIYFIYGSDPDERKSYKMEHAEHILTHPKFDESKPTSMYIHGFLQSITETSVEDIIESYLSSGQFNILIFDWGPLASDAYPVAALNVVLLGKSMATVLKRLFKIGLDLSTFHLVGHSLGAQMSGVIGNQIQENSKGKTILPRITGLDPAGPMFFKLLGLVPVLLRQLRPSDAKFVDVIHSDASFMGCGDDTGTVDFYPNGGSRFQPGCPFVSSFYSIDGQKCSHERSVMYFCQSMLNSDDTTAFVAVQARSWGDFQAGNTIDSRVAQMGVNCPLDITGKWFLQTGEDEPYTLGIEGTKYQHKDGLLRSIINVASQAVGSVLGVLVYK